MSSKYKSGDKVFAKVRGYPFWPARIDACADETPNKMKYHVYFYGTAETAICKAEEVVPYYENKDKYGKPLKRKGFNEGLQQIEIEINGGVPVAFSYSESADYDHDSGSNGSIIDESAQAAAWEKKKEKLLSTIKRKRESFDGSEDSLSRKVPRLSSGTPLPQTQTVTTSVGRSPVEGDSPPNKMKAVSRSGRKIKPKKFADDEEEELDSSEGSAFSSAITGIPPEISSGLNVSSITPAAEDTPTFKVRQPQGSLRSTLPTQPSPDESANTAGDAQVVIPSENPQRAILARALSGHWVQIRLDDDRPAVFKSERARQMWDAATARNAERLKAQIELGEYLPESIKKQLEGKAELTEAQKKELKKENELQRKRGKLRWLKQEAHLLELDAQIRASLSLAKADTQRCLQLMDDMLHVNIDPLMLKKHPNIVDTMKKLQRYIGNTGKWGLSEEEAEQFNASCEQIKLKASHMYHKFKKLFAVPNNKSFWDVFSEELERFNQAVKHMSKDKMYALVVDPQKLANVQDSDEEQETHRKKSVKSPKTKQPILPSEDAVSNLAEPSSNA